MGYGWLWFTATWHGHRFRGFQWYQTHLPGIMSSALLMSIPRSEVMSTFQSNWCVPFDNLDIELTDVIVLTLI